MFVLDREKLEREKREAEDRLVELQYRNETLKGMPLMRQNERDIVELRNQIHNLREDILSLFDLLDDIYR